MKVFNEQKDENSDTKLDNRNIKVIKLYGYGNIGDTIWYRSQLTHTHTYVEM